MWQSTNWHFIRFSSDVPSDRDVQLAVIEAKKVHALAFPCRRIGNSWVNALTNRPLEVYPTHWRNQFDPNKAAAQFNRPLRIKSKLRLHVVAAAAIVIALFLVISELGLAAQRSHRAPAHPGASVKKERSTPQANGLPPYDPRGTSRYPWGAGYNLPYPDRPYGAPGGW
jgi:hypothetical protein